MSAGQFQRSRYLADDGVSVHPVRVQPETLSLEIGSSSNEPPTGAINESASARVSGSRRALGVNCRKIRVQFTAAPPAGYAANQTLSIPILQPGLFQGTSKGNVGTYLGVAIQVVGKTPEYVN